MAEAALQDGNDFSGLTILDVSEIQARVVNPQVKIVSRLAWPQISTPQNATPFTRNGHKYLLETDEFGSGKNIARTQPSIVSQLRARMLDLKND